MGKVRRIIEKLLGLIISVIGLGEMFLCLVNIRIFNVEAELFVLFNFAIFLTGISILI